MIRHPSNSLLLRVWLGSHTAIFPLAFVALGFTMVFLCLLPLGPPQPLTGVVQEVTFVSSKSSISRIAHVRLGSATILVGIGNQCAPGDVIHLSRRPQLWGYSYAADWIACPDSSVRS